MITANSDGVFYQDDVVRFMNMEIDRLNYLLEQWKHYKTKEEIQQRINRIEKQKEDYIKEQFKKVK